MKIHPIYFKNKEDAYFSLTFIHLVNIIYTGKVIFHYNYGGNIMPFKFDITKNIGVLSETASGYKKELNLVSWNGKEPKYDIRVWDAAHEKPGKGVTLSDEEYEILKDLLTKEEK